MASLHIHANPKIEVGTRDWGVAVIGLTMFLFGAMWILVTLDSGSIGMLKMGLNEPS